MSPRRTASVTGVLLLGAGLPLTTPTAAHACSCAGRSVAAYAAASDLVVAGRVRHVRGLWSSDEAVVEVAVDRRYQGELPEGPVEIRTPDLPGCENPPPTGERWVFFAVRRGGGLGRVGAPAPPRPAGRPRSSEHWGRVRRCSPLRRRVPRRASSDFGALGLPGVLAVAGLRRHARRS